MQWLLQNIQILIFAIVILSSILGPVFKWLGDKRQQLRIENERKRRELEEMRTGRVEQQSPTPEELERMIEEQLAAQRAEMLRQRAEQAEARRQAAQKRAEQAKRKRDAATQKASAEVSKVVKATQSYAEASKLSTKPMIPIEAMGPQIHAHHASRATKRAPSAAVVGKLGPAELRKAIVLTEILGKPVAMRQDDNGLI